MGLETLAARDQECGRIADFLGGSLPGSLVLEGAPGIGKSSLWEHATTLAAAHGHRVLSARASNAEAGLPFGAVIDLLDGVAAAELAVLPAPQRLALEVALYRAEPGTRPPEPHAIALGLLGVLRSLAGSAPLLVALDDVQWLDPASDGVLAYVGRRLPGSPIRVLLARRPGTRSALEEALERLQVLPVGPLDLDAVRHVLAHRLGLRLPEHRVRTVFETTLGNPLFVLEIGRLLAARGDAADDRIPLPENVEELLGLRIADLDPGRRRVLLALALDAQLRVDQLRALAGADLDGAVDSGVVLVSGDRARVSHPLVAAAAAQHAGWGERRALHAEISGIVTDPEPRALHAALAAPGVDEGLAGQLSDAVPRAAGRGAVRLAVELASHAVRLTPAGSPDADVRLLELGQQLAVAGEKDRLTALLGDRVPRMEDRANRVRGTLLLAKGVVRDNAEIRQLQEKALEEASGDRALEVPVLAELAENEAVILVTGIPRARARAEEAVRAADGGPAADLRLALSALAWCRALSGEPVDDLAERYHDQPEDWFLVGRSPRRVAAQRAVWRGENDRARALLTGLRALSEERAEATSSALVRLHVIELELRIGNGNAAEKLLDDWAASADSSLLVWPMYERCRALLAAVRGDGDRARSWGERALTLAEELGVRWDWLEAQRALGTAAVLRKDLPAAAQHFRTVWDYTRAEGIADPGAHPVGADLVEVLVDLGDREAARDIASALTDVAGTTDHPWARLAGRRGEALCIGDGEALEAVAADYRELGLWHEHARTLLARGRGERRARKWGASRETLARAAEAFTALGADGWVRETEAETERVGARRPRAPGSLTPTEARVAGLAVEGLSNKEIAHALVVTVNTVEFHLRNVYTKLGIRSRGQLAAKLVEQDNPGVNDHGLP